MSATRTRTAAKIVLVLLLDAALGSGAATILWNSGGTTVTNGSWIAQTMCFVFLTIMLTARNTFARIERSALPRPEESAIQPCGDILLIGGLSTAWLLSSDYFIGWLACFGAVLLFTASLCQFLAALICQPMQPEGRRHASITRRFATLATVRIVTVLASIAMLALLVGIHDWALYIFDVLLVLTGGSVLLAAAIAAWITALRQRHVDPTPSSKPAPRCLTDTTATETEH